MGCGTSRRRTTSEYINNQQVFRSQPLRVNLKLKAIRKALILNKSNLITIREVRSYMEVSPQRQD